MKYVKPEASVTAVIVQAANPLGSVVAYTGSQDPPPDGLTGGAVWLLCDGRALDQHLYPELFKLIGNSFGNGTTNNPTHIQNAFNIPDLRGRFVRGTDDMGGAAAGNDPDAASRTAMMTGGNTGQTANKVGSLQADGFAGHTHSYVGKYQEAKDGTGFKGWGFDSNSHTGAQVFMMSSTGGSETRPRNAYLNYIIRVK